MSRPDVGFIGLGNIGFRMAARLIETGWPLVVFDTRPKASYVNEVVWLFAS